MWFASALAGSCMEWRRWWWSAWMTRWGFFPALAGRDTSTATSRAVRPGMASVMVQPASVSLTEGEVSEGRWDRS